MCLYIVVFISCSCRLLLFINKGRLFPSEMQWQSFVLSLLCVCVERWLIERVSKKMHISCCRPSLTISTPAGNPSLMRKLLYYINANVNTTISSLSLNSSFQSFSTKRAWIIYKGLLRCLTNSSDSYVVLFVYVNDS